MDLGWRFDLPINEPWWWEEDRRAAAIFETDDYFAIANDYLDRIVAGFQIYGTTFGEGVDISFPDLPGRHVEQAIITGLNPENITFLYAGDIAYGIRAVWNRPDGVPIPDTGSTVALLGLALCGLFFTRKLHHEMT